MRPTRRGLGLLAVAVAAIAMGIQFGQVGLNAVAGPILVALLAAVGQVALTGHPSVERDPPRRGHHGETRTVRLAVDGSGIASITDTLPDGLEGTASVRRSLPATFSYDVTYAARGEYQLGPVEVVLTDALGLVCRRVTVDATDDVLVYPAVYRMGGRDAFGRTLGTRSEDRQAFDRLREYVPGDSLRDVHWKSSAKRDEMLVREYADHRGDESLLIVGEADDGAGDAMATAVATIAVAALESGRVVELSVPGERVPPGHSETHRTRLLEALARTPAGETPDAESADILVEATAAGVTVTVEGRARPFSAVTAGQTDPTTEVVES